MSMEPAAEPAAKRQRVAGDTAAAAAAPSATPTEDQRQAYLRLVRTSAVAAGRAEKNIGGYTGRHTLNRQMIAMGASLGELLQRCQSTETLTTAGRTEISDLIDAAVGKVDAKDSFSKAAFRAVATVYGLHPPKPQKARPRPSHSATAAQQARPAAVGGAAGGEQIVTTGPPTAGGATQAGGPGLTRWFQTLVKCPVAKSFQITLSATCTVIGVGPGSEAELAGVKAGDKIIGVDDKPVYEDLTQLATKMQAPATHH